MPCNLCQYDVVRAEKHRFLLVTNVYKSYITSLYGTKEIVMIQDYVTDFINGDWNVTRETVSDKEVLFVEFLTLKEFLDFLDTETCGEMFWWSNDGIYEWALVI